MFWIYVAAIITNVVINSNINGMYCMGYVSPLLWQSRFNIIYITERGLECPNVDT